MSQGWNTLSDSANPSVSSTPNPWANSPHSQTIVHQLAQAPEPSPIAQAILTAPAVTDTQLTALWLHDLGLNSFPIMYGTKDSPPVWKPLQFSRLRKPELPRIFAGQCNIAVMCGRTSRNLTVLDCETPNAFDYYRDQFQQRRIPVWAVCTARGGHLWFFCHEGEVENIAKGRLGDLEIRGSQGYVLCPPSLHPWGTFYTWKRDPDLPEPPTISIQQLDGLRDTDGNRVKLKVKGKKKSPTHAQEFKRRQGVASQLGLDERVYRLSKTTLEYLENGNQFPEGTRNKRLFRAACDMLGCAFSAIEVGDILTRIAAASGLPCNQIEATLGSASSKTRTPSRPQTYRSYSRRPSDWRFALAYIQTADWSGRTGSTDRMIALALAHRARLGSNENGVFRASFRELGALARRTHRQTLGKALQRLQERRFIQAAGSDKGSGASRWRFHKDALQKGKQALEAGLFESEPLIFGQVVWYTNGSVFNSSPTAGPTDAAERGALGVEGLMVYEALRQFAEPVLPKWLAQRTRLSRNQVNYRLQRLKRFGLVERTPQGWRVLYDLDSQSLDEQVAAPAGKLGTGLRRQQRFVEDRAAFTGRRILLWRLRHDPGFSLEGYRCRQCRTWTWCESGQPPLVCSRCGHDALDRHGRQGEYG